ncbi:flowering time control protein FPA [Andrographis paniculata]|uniref:flowering time control protein FPA n=1 Tax=Andrographis paniculata TaxID=175694 RepID=UPI0021E8C82D|nr:flowering time control protein FPA [Andrographis paniculata]
MAPPVRAATDPSQSLGGGVDLSRQNPPSNTLWIGNVSPAVSETELRALLEQHGKVDSFTPYPSRNYAFVYFREIEVAKTVKKVMQGFLLRGSPLKIEFAKPAKPCKSLWVAGISPSVSKEELEKEFLRFGNIQELRFLRDRNTAYIDYVRLEDATQALKAMNRKEIGGAHIRVDYLRSHSSRKEFGSDPREVHFLSRNMGLADLHWMGEDALITHPEHILPGTKMKSHLMLAGSDALPSRVLLISYPPSIAVDEDMLHNAMILFGEIEGIKTVIERNCALVEFRSVEEARCAKEGLQGKLFNDPRIRIDYYNVEFPAVRGQVGDPLQPLQMDFIGLHRAVLIGNNPGHASSIGIHGPDAYTRPSLAHALHGLDVVDLSAVHKLQNPSPRNLMGGPTWRSSPTSRLVSSPSETLNAPKRSASGAWDVYDALKNESKKPRFDASFPTENQSGLDERYGQRSINSEAPSSSITRATTVGRKRHADNDCIWRGLIAKGGTPVCQARCVPIEDGLDAEIPSVVNISARTGLDLLSQRYEDAIGFNIVFFLPDSEEDFASYTEFLRYLGSRERAGVAKFDDGTTLFLVPPSDFLTKVLKVSGPERLYGVVLKFPQAAPNVTTMNSQSIHHQYADLPKMTTLSAGYNVVPRVERVLPSDNSRARSDDSKVPSKNVLPVTSSLPAVSVPPAPVASQAGLTLTPELIATLTSLLPASSTSGSQPATVQQTPPVMGTPDVDMAANPNVGHWKQNQALVQNSQLVQQPGYHVNPQLQQLQAGQGTHVIPNLAGGHYHQAVNSYSQTMTTAQAPGSSKSMPPAIPLQNLPVSAGPDPNLHYQHGSSQVVPRGQVVDNRTDALRLYNPSVVQQPAYSSVPLSNQVQVNNVPQSQPYMPLPSDVDVSHQSQALQTAPFLVSQEQPETEADKNERYKTTLLFAANLLSRIHQPEPGAGNH